MREEAWWQLSANAREVRPCGRFDQGTDIADNGQVACLEDFLEPGQLRGQAELARSETRGIGRVEREEVGAVARRRAVARDDRIGMVHAALQEDADECLVAAGIGSEGSSAGQGAEHPRPCEKARGGAGAEEVAAIHVSHSGYP